MNVHAQIGHNNPPAEPVELTPFDLSKAEIEGLFMEAKNWCDGTPIETQAQADQVAKLQNDIRAAMKTADARRVAENEPFDAGKAAVQAKYAPLIADTKAVKGKGVMALDACKAALGPFLIEQDRIKRAAEAKLRVEAEAKRAEAESAFRAAGRADIAKREEAEALLIEAKRADAAVMKAANDKAVAKGSGSRGAALHTFYEAEITDLRAFARFCWTDHLDELLPAFQVIADRLVRGGMRSLAGVTVHERQRVQ